MSNYNSQLILDETSLVFIDPKTKGHKTLQDLLTKRNVKWVNTIEKDVTHSVCTRYATDSLYIYAYRNFDGSVIQYYHGIDNNETERNWHMLESKKVYSYNEFIYLLNNSNRTTTEYSDNIIKLLKTGDKTNVELALVMMDNYTVDPRWIPWLKMCAWIIAVRKYLRKINIKFNINMGNKDSHKWRIESVLNPLDIPEEYRLEFLKEILNEE